jgi:V8-like Glu-specific endopeptidase
MYSTYSNIISPGYREIMQPEIFRGELDYDIVGTSDTRLRITKTTLPPFRYICQLFLTMSDGKNYAGTAFFIGPKTLLTAGHNVWDHFSDSKLNNENIIISPARDGSNFPFKPKFASFNPVDTVLSYPGFSAKDSITYRDYAILHIEKPTGEETGYFGQGITGIDKLGSSILKGKLPLPLKQQDLNICGYPGDLDDKTGSRQYLSYNYGNEFLDGGRIITYFNDTSGGMSGSPIWIKRSPDNGGRIIAGIHIDHGTEIKTGKSKFNRGVFMTDEVRKFISDNMQ